MEPGKRVLEPLMEVSRGVCSGFSLTVEVNGLSHLASSMHLSGHWQPSAPSLPTIHAVCALMSHVYYLYETVVKYMCYRIHSILHFSETALLCRRALNS